MFSDVELFEKKREISPAKIESLYLKPKTHNGLALQKILSEKILKNPETLNEIAVLGKANGEYLISNSEENDYFTLSISFEYPGENSMCTAKVLPIVSEDNNMYFTGDYCPIGIKVNPAVDDLEFRVAVYLPHEQNIPSINMKNADFIFKIEMDANQVRV